MQQKYTHFLLEKTTMAPKPLLSNYKGVSHLSVLLLISYTEDNKEKVRFLISIRAETGMCNIGQIANIIIKNTMFSQPTGCSYIFKQSYLLVHEHTFTHLLTHH